MIVPVVVAVEAVVWVVVAVELEVVVLVTVVEVAEVGMHR